MKEKKKVNPWTAGVQKQQSCGREKKCHLLKLFKSFSFCQNKKNARIKPENVFVTIKILDLPKLQVPG